MRLLVFLTALTLASDPAAQAETVRNAPWRTEEVGVGVVWKRHHFDQLFGAKQHVNVLEIDATTSPAPRLQIAPAKGRQRTSALGRQALAVAAINGGYFDTKNGAPVGVLKVGGKLLRDDSAPKWVGIGIAKDGKTSFLEKPHDQHAKFEHALAAGPMLLHSGKPTPHTGWENMAKVRHPRSAIGTTERGRLVCVVVDGRTPESAGMTCEELAETMGALGCTTAMNLDGGGSSALWVRGEADDGIVSCPCDDKTFDHAGERAVANALVVEAADVVVGDDSDATLTPRERFVGRSDGGSVLGLHQLAEDGSGASAAWQLDGMLPGRYRLSVTWPRSAGAIVAEFGDRKVRCTPPKEAGAWIDLGEVDLTKTQALHVRLSPDGQGPFAVDALRLVQLR